MNTLDLTILVFFLSHSFSKNIAVILDRYLSKCLTLSTLKDRALIKAVIKSRIDLVKLLIDHGADVNGTDTKGKSPLSWAAFKGEINIVTALLESNADVNQVDIYGYTPLMFAIKEARTEVVELLIAYGADVNKANIYGHTPLMIAKYIYPDITSMIQAHQLKIKILISDIRSLEGREFCDKYVGLVCDKETQFSLIEIFMIAGRYITDRCNIPIFGSDEDNNRLLYLLNHTDTKDYWQLYQFVLEQYPNDNSLHRQIICQALRENYSKKIISESDYRLFFSINSRELYIPVVLLAATITTHLMGSHRREHRPPTLSSQALSIIFSSFSRTGKIFRSPTVMR